MVKIPFHLVCGQYASIASPGKGFKSVDRLVQLLVRLDTCRRRRLASALDPDAERESDVYRGYVLERLLRWGV